MEEQAKKLSKFISRHEYFFNYYPIKKDFQCDIIKFFIEEHWKKQVPEEWKKPLLTMSNEELFEMINEGKINENFPKSLIEFVKTAKELELPQECLKVETIEIGKEKKIKPKKKYEVERMTKIIADTAEKYHCKTVIDIGSGRGYLTNLLSEKYGLNVIGIDNKENITESSIKRNKNEKNEKLNLLTFHISLEMSVKDFETLIEPYMDKNDNYLLIGLHTCGDLGASVIQLFKKSNAKALINVGCCYNKISEKGHGNEIYGYPMSKSCSNSFLNYGKVLGNLSETNIFLFRKNSFRAALECLLQSNLKDKSKETEFRIRTTHQNSYSFEEYSYEGIKKLLESNSDLFESSFKKNFENIEEFKKMLIKYYQTFNPDKDGIIREFACFWSLRAMFSPLIEAIILMDRTLYLKENKLDADLVRIFDPKISPRGFMIISKK
eukprot:gene6096-10103_t